MTSIQIDGGMFLPALRKVIQSLPLANTDHDVLLKALDECASKRHKALDVLARRARMPFTTPEARLKWKLYQRQYRARRKAQAERVGT